MDALKEITPFAEVANPLVEKVAKGLSGVGRLTGERTKVENADVGSVASMLRMKEMMEKEVVGGLWELRERTGNRVKLLGEMEEEQKKQVRGAQEERSDGARRRMLITKPFWTHFASRPSDISFLSHSHYYLLRLSKIAKLKMHIQQLKSRVEENSGRYQTHLNKAQEIEERSGAALAACGELAKGLTNAEKGYFAQLKSWEGQTNRWEVELKELAREARKMEGGGKLRVELCEREEDMCEDLLRGQGVLVRKCEDATKRAGEKMRDVGGE